MTEKFQSRSKGIKAMSNAINPAPARPLMYTKRDKVGPNGQAIGSITTDPREVDQIATRAWQKIYNGNFDDLKGAANAFMNKYKQYIYSSKEFKVQPITGKAFMRTCIQGGNTCTVSHCLGTGFRVTPRTNKEI